MDDTYGIGNWQNGGQTSCPLLRPLRLFRNVARTHKFAETYFQYKRHKRLVDDRTTPEVFVRIGPPGTGKTKWMDDTYGIGN
jgi:hypothetical protein